MKKKYTLGLCVIAKDEAKNIARCIESVKSIVGEIVVVDTGSADDTAEIARSLGASVYYYPWDNSFSNAKNFAMEKAKSQWLLLLDADEALDGGSLDLITGFIGTTELDGAHFRVRNYTGTYSPDNYNLHSALRLLRNNGKYRYKGNIHEQIVAEGCAHLYDRFATLEVILHHYGYLDEAVREKKKRQRNIPILEKALEENPGDPFTLFNLGNEYLSAGDYKKALEYYELSKSGVKDANLAFVPHLYFRMVNCHEALRQYNNALALLAEGLARYPGCTDYEHVRANIQLKLKRYTLAVTSLEKCLKMGAPPTSLEFISGCGGYRSSFLLGEIYCQLEDYARALEYYKRTLNSKTDMYTALYKAGHALNRLLEDKAEVRRLLFSYFANPDYPPNIVVGADILITEGLYDEALAVLGAQPAPGAEVTELFYLRARALLFSGQPEEACRLLDTLLESGQPVSRLLPHMGEDAALTYFTAGLALDSAETLREGLRLAESLCDIHGRNACALLNQIYADTAPTELFFDGGGAAELEKLLVVYDMLLRLGRFEVFEKLLRVLNYIDSKNLLLRLAHLFWKNGFEDLAADYVLRSVKELDALDEFGAMILFRKTADPAVVQPLEQETENSAPVS